MTLEEAARETPCPLCHKLSLWLSYKLVAKPIGEFSLSGQQMKFSCVQYPILTCTTAGCDFRARGQSST